MTTERTIDIFFDGLLTEPRLDHPEGIAVHPDGSVWCGGEAGQIYRIADGRIEQVASTGGFCLGLAFDSAGNLFVCDLAHASVFRLDRQALEVELFADGADGRRFVGPNMVAVDSADKVYVTDNGRPNEPGLGIYRFDSGGLGRVWHPGPWNFANGLALSTDESTMYVAETWRRRIAAITIDGAGDAGEVATVVELPAMLPDGLAVDAHGRLYVACYQPSQVLAVDTATGNWSVVAHDPDAHLLCHPTNLAFHGEDLLVANLGRWHIASIHLGVTGPPLPPRLSWTADPTAAD